MVGQLLDHHLGQAIGIENLILCIDANAGVGSDTGESIGSVVPSQPC